MSITTRWIAASLAAVLLSACGPSLDIRHYDPSAAAADVWLDGRLVGTVEYGKSLSVGVDPGPHSIMATRAGERTNPWLEPGDTWEVVVTNDVVLTLLPRKRRSARQ